MENEECLQVKSHINKEEILSEIKDVKFIKEKVDVVLRIN